MQLTKIMPSPRFAGHIDRLADGVEAGNSLCLHGLADMQAGRFGHLPEVELHDRLVGFLDVELVLFLFVADEFGLVETVRDGRQHRVGNVPDPAEPGGFPGQFTAGNIHAHTADYDRHQLALAKAQAKIINSFHYCHPPAAPGNW